MDEGQNHEPEDGPIYLRRDESGDASNLNYSDGFLSPSEYFHWGMQNGHQGFQFAFTPQAVSSTTSAAMNSFQPDLSSSLLGLQYPAAAPNIASSSLNRLSRPSGAAQDPPSNRDDEVEQIRPQLMSPPPRKILQAPAARRSKYASLEWDKYKKIIEKLYLDDERPLEEVLNFMIEHHSFNASVKLYKEKFKQWGWCKYMPNDVARWMLAKGDKRMLEDRKETVFLLGGRVWALDRIQRSAKRVKQDDIQSISSDAPTPFGVTYRTPRLVSDNPSPQNGLSPRITYSNATKWTPAPGPSMSHLTPFRTTWNGHTRTDLAIIQRQAKEFEERGNLDDAEKLFREVLAGLEHLLSPTHEDTNTAGYELAAFYARHDRMDDTDKVLSWMSEKHVERWGLKHRKTSEHVLHVIDLLNGWFRPEDALCFVYQATDIWEKTKAGTGKDVATSRHRESNDSLAVGRSARSSDLPQSCDEIDDPSAVDNHLRSVKAHINAKDESIEPFLLSLIEQCEKNPELLALQNLRARCELVELYQKLERDEDASLALTKARESFTTIWELESKKNKELMEASVELGKLLLVAGKDGDAKEVLRKVEEEAVDKFGPDDDRTIWLLMRIGVAYQNQRDWDEAEPWFEQALAAAMAAHDLDDGMVKTLEAALENRCYSTLPKESGAFKSILGTCGIVIKPGSFFLGAD